MSNDIILVSESGDIQTFPDFSHLLNEYSFASLEQQEEFVKHLTDNLAKKKKLQEIIPSIDKYGYAISFNKVDLPGYKILEDTFHVEAYGNYQEGEETSEIDFEFRYIKTEILPVLTLLKLTGHKLTGEEFEMLTKKNVKLYSFMEGHDDEDFCGIYDLSLGLYIYTRNVTEITQERKYFIIAGYGDGYDIVYSSYGKFYYMFDSEKQNIKANDPHKADLKDENILVIPWLFDEAPTKELQEKFWTF